MGHREAGNQRRSNPEPHSTTIRCLAVKVNAQLPLKHLRLPCIVRDPWGCRILKANVGTAFTCLLCRHMGWRKEEDASVHST